VAGSSLRAWLGERGSGRRTRTLPRVPITKARSGPVLLTLLSVSPDGQRWSDPSEALIDTGAATTVIYPRSDARTAGISLGSGHELTLEAADGRRFRAAGVQTWIRLFEPPEHWQLRVPVYFADVPEPIIGLELLQHYFTIRSGTTAWTLRPKLSAARRLRLPLRRSTR
jgi:hypothetical protein